MTSPPLDARPGAAFTSSGWRSALAGYVLVAAVPLLLWVASHPLAGAVVLAAVGGTVAGVRTVLRLGRCLHECGGFSVDLGGRVRIAVSKPGVENA